MKFRTMLFFIISFFLVANNIFPVFAMAGQRLKRRSISPLSSHLIVATYTSLIEITTASAPLFPSNTPANEARGPWFSISSSFMALPPHTVVSFYP